MDMALAGCGHAGFAHRSSPPGRHSGIRIRHQQPVTHHGLLHAEKGTDTTRLQEAAYGAQWAAALPLSELARTLLVENGGRIRHQSCALYIHTVQETAWFNAAFTAHAEPVAVVGGRGVSHADAALRRVKIGTNDRWDAGRCEQACLHELAHIVTNDHARGGELCEPGRGSASSRGHHHAWRANFVLIVRMTLGGRAATRLRQEFTAWGLPTHK